MAVILDDVFLGFGIHFVGKYDFWVAMSRCPKRCPEETREEKSEMWEGILPELEKLIRTFSTTFCRMGDGNKHRVL